MNKLKLISVVVPVFNSVYRINAFYTNGYLKKIAFSENVEQKIKNQFVFYGYWKSAENIDGPIWFIKRFCF